MKGFKGNLKAKLLLTFWFSLNLIYLYFWKGLMMGDTFFHLPISGRLLRVFWRMRNWQLWNTNMVIWSSKLEIISPGKASEDDKTFRKQLIVYGLYFAFHQHAWKCLVHHTPRSLQNWSVESGWRSRLPTRSCCPLASTSQRSDTAAAGDKGQEGKELQFRSLVGMAQLCPGCPFPFLSLAFLSCA